MQKVTLSIIVPVYNEEKTVYELLLRLHNLKMPESVKKEIIVVDDGSLDSSAKHITRAERKIPNLKIYTHKKNLGKGAAVILGIRKCSGDIITIQDADLEYEPKDLLKLIAPILNGKAAVVYGTRLKHYPLRILGKKKTPLVSHYFGNKFLTFITNVLYGSNITDMETCYKVLRKDVLKQINFVSRGFELEAELTAKLLKRRFKIYEIPIKVDPRGYEEGKKITWRDGFIAVWTLIKYRFVD